MKPVIPFTNTTIPQNTEEKSPHVSVMELACLAGELLLQNGGEIYRVQETLTRIIDACGYPRHNVYVLSNGLFVTINEGSPDACSAVRYVPLGAVNLSRIADINQISRDLCHGDCDREQAYERLLKCREPIPDRHLIMMAACGVGGGGFAVLFGGNLLDGLFGFFIGCGLQFLLYYLATFHMSRFMNNMIASFYVTMASALALLTTLPLHFDKLVIGVIITLVPGYAFTTGIRDFFNSDFLSGTIHLLDAICTACSIAIGVGVAILLIQTMGGGLML